MLGQLARILRAVGLGPILALICSTPASATVVKALTLQEKVAVSPLIVHAEVERIEIEWEVPDAAISTFITLRVIDSLKGGMSPDARIIVRQQGGTIGAFTQHVSGMSEFELGEEVVLFLEPNGPHYVEVGIGIAKYAVTSSGGQKWVRHTPQVSAARFEAGRIVRIEAAEPMGPEPLARFLDDVQKLVNAAPTGVPVLRVPGRSP
jgi:hypothetical protein